MLVVSRRIHGELVAQAGKTTSYWREIGRKEERGIMAWTKKRRGEKKRQPRKREILFSVEISCDQLCTGVLQGLKIYYHIILLAVWIRI